MAQEGWLGLDILARTPGSQHRMVEQGRVLGVGTLEAEPWRLDGDLGVDEKRNLSEGPWVLALQFGDLLLIQTSKRLSPRPGEARVLRGAAQPASRNTRASWGQTSEPFLHFLSSVGLEDCGWAAALGPGTGGAGQVG